jgi:hypothetical protein
MCSDKWVGDIDNFRDRGGGFFEGGFFCLLKLWGKRERKEAKERELVVVIIIYINIFLPLSI